MEPLETPVRQARLGARDSVERLETQDRRVRQEDPVSLEGLDLVAVLVSVDLPEVLDSPEVLVLVDLLVLRGLLEFLVDLVSLEDRDLQEDLVPLETRELAELQVSQELRVQLVD